MVRLRVAIIAPPWITVPPKGYGGIEEVINNLARELLKLGHEVELFSVGGSKIRGVKVHSLYKEEQYHHIHKPIYETLPISIAHQQFALNKIRQDGKFDIIHDHNGYIGPAILHYATQLPDIPPALHTLHGPPFSGSRTLEQNLPDNRHLWRQLDHAAAHRLYFVGISEALTRNAPTVLKPRILPAVHNALDTNEFIFREKKKPFFLTLGRFSHDKGQHVAARLCDELGYKLEMAGTVSSISSPKRLMLELANPLSKYRNMADFRYYSDEILPITINNKNIVNIGNIKGKEKLNKLANAKALLFPISWDEPFGMVVIEALASGTPVVAMKRGAMPEIIRHGVTGFLANSAKEFREYMQRVDEIDPVVCRRSVEKKFSSTVMAKNYVSRYLDVIKTAVKL